MQGPVAHNPDFQDPINVGETDPPNMNLKAAKKYYAESLLTIAKCFKYAMKCQARV